MKRFVFIISVFALLFAACDKEDDELLLSGTGTVIDYAGAGNCGIIIELDNGARIQPLFYPQNVTFRQGQRVHVDYVELTNIVPSCDKGSPAEITFVEDMSCFPYIDLDFNNYDSLARDPVYVNEAFVDGNCLQILISYSGGCEEHSIELARMHPWTASSSTVPTFEIRHNANGDMCEALFTRELRFDITPLIDEGKKEFVLTSKLYNGEVYNKIFEIK
jgi:nitrous oxide reductase accessory protein NosL